MEMSKDEQLLNNILLQEIKKAIEYLSKNNQQEILVNKVWLALNTLGKMFMNRNSLETFVVNYKNITKDEAQGEFVYKIKGVKASNKPISLGFKFPLNKGK